MDMRIPPLRIKITLESNPLKSTMLVGRLAAENPTRSRRGSARRQRDQREGHGGAPRLLVKCIIINIIVIIFVIMIMSINCYYHYYHYHVLD